jgi:hypothetical protein
MRSAAPAQKVSGASAIEEFNHGKSHLRVVLEDLSPGPAAKSGNPS